MTWEKHWARIFPVTCPAAGTTNQAIQKGFGRCLITHVTADWIQNLKGYLLSECRYHQLLHIFNHHWKTAPEKRHQPRSCSVFLSRYVDVTYCRVSHGCPPAWNKYPAVWLRQNGSWNSLVYTDGCFIVCTLKAVAVCLLKASAWNWKWNHMCLHGGERERNGKETF